MSSEVHILCAGAVKGLVLALQEGFERDSGVRVDARFGAVGAMRDELQSGAPCDVFVATDAMIAALEASGELRAGSGAPIGRVQTALAVKAGAAAPKIDSVDALRAALLGADALYFPDATRSTAGAHVAAVLDRLGVRTALASCLRMYANGATAMRALAESGEARPLGCTQATEILYTPGIVPIGALPPPFTLATVYSAAIGAAARADEAARRLVDLLTGPASAALRRAGGFDAA